LEARGNSCAEAAKGEKIDPAVQDYAAMADVFKSGDVAVSILRWRLSLVAHPRFSRAMAKSRAEVFFNQMQPFYNAMVIYVLAGCSRFFHGSICRKLCGVSAVWLIALAFFNSHDGFEFIELFLQGRPPVTNCIPRRFSSAGRVLARNDFGKFTKTESARWFRRAWVSSRSSSAQISHSTAHDGNDALPCWTRISGWPRMSSRDRGLCEPRFVAGIPCADLHRARRVHKKLWTKPPANRSRG